MAHNITSQHVEWAKEVQKHYGVPASVTLGQFIYESGAGTSNMAKLANNGFGVKGTGNAGSYYSRGSSWAKYYTMHDSFLAYGRLLTNERYTKHTASASNTREYLEGLVKGGYCSDSDYVSNVMSIIKSNNLTQYDGDSYNVPESTGSLLTGVTSSDDGFFTGIAKNVTKVVFIIVLCILGVLFLAGAFRG